MTDEMALLLAPRDKFVTLNIFDRKFSVDFSKDMLFWRVWNIAFWRALSTEQYQSALIVGLCGDSLQELALCNRVRLVRFPGHCGIHGNEDADVFARTGSSSAFVRPKSCLPLAPSSVKRREREWLLKSHCTSRSLETAFRQSIWVKRSNPDLTKYLLRLPISKLRILVGLSFRLTFFDFFFWENLRLIDWFSVPIVFFWDIGLKFKISLLPQYEFWAHCHF
jgi:hypothetical protein